MSLSLSSDGIEITDPSLMVAAANTAAQIMCIIPQI